MNVSEFSVGAPTARRGMTSIEAIQFLRKEHPAIDEWMCWSPSPGRRQSALKRLPVGEHAEGAVGAWTWHRVKTSYPKLGYCQERLGDSSPDRWWVGMVEVTSPEKKRFALFSYLNSTGTVGDLYMVSTCDHKILGQFTRDAAAHFDKGETRAKISVFGEQDVYLDPGESRHVFMPPGLREDIYSQVDSFFTSPDMYRSRGIPYRRGMLFVGPPGNGKTMMVRELVKRCWRKYHTDASALVAAKHTDDMILQMVFGEATVNGKGIVILEEIDALAKETDLTRATLLDRLDGLSSAEGVLVIATTNNPGDVDPALIHRPSRFDRVWHFEPPDEKLRRDYLSQAMDGVDQALLDELVSGTAGWSFAYLNELRTTAAVLAVGSTKLQIPPDCVSTAYRMLADQFRAGRRNHVKIAGPGNVGFGAR